jgi:hypothetical protein
MIYTYNLFFYLNADERVESDPHYRKQYSIVMLPLIRNMIDCAFRNKLATVLDWSTGYFCDVDTARLELEAREQVA